MTKSAKEAKKKGQEIVVGKGGKLVAKWRLWSDERRAKRRATMARKRREGLTGKKGSKAATKKAGKKGTAIVPVKGELLDADNHPVRRQYTRRAGYIGEIVGTDDIHVMRQRMIKAYEYAETAQACAADPTDQEGAVLFAEMSKRALRGKRTI